MLQRLDTEERVCYTTYDLELIDNWFSAGMAFDVYYKEPAHAG
jgi:hypothetical protein